jgi:hypothetical protein
VPPENRPLVACGNVVKLENIRQLREKISASPKWVKLKIFEWFLLDESRLQIAYFAKKWNKSIG